PPSTAPDGTASRGLRRLLGPRVRIPRRSAAANPGESGPSSHIGTKIQNPAYAMTPTRLNQVATTNASRTQSTGTPRWSASPCATPPTIRCLAGRYIRRYAHAGWDGEVTPALSDMSKSSHANTRGTSGRNPDRSLILTRVSAVRIREVPNGHRAGE